MKQGNAAEVLLSAAVFAMAAGFLLFTYVRTSGPGLSDYELTVEMTQANGLQPGSDVQISGIKVGTVSQMSLSGRRALVHLMLHDEIRIPRDSVAAAISGGVLATGAVLAIRPGKSQDMLPAGGRLTPLI
jgi:phospholipid/cholesterol/gamma-HCH transport system substrate-binding protein